MSIIDRVRGFLATRRTNYIRAFNNPAGEAVLKDLAKFCRATETTYHSDPRMHAVLEGRREVWLRIQQHLRMTEDQLWDTYKIKDIPDE